MLSRVQKSRLRPPFRYDFKKATETDNVNNGHKAKVKAGATKPLVL